MSNFNFGPKKGKIFAGKSNDSFNYFGPSPAIIKAIDSGFNDSQYPPGTKWFGTCPVDLSLFTTDMKPDKTFYTNPTSLKSALCLKTTKCIDGYIEIDDTTLPFHHIDGRDVNNIDYLLIGVSFTITTANDTVTIYYDYDPVTNTYANSIAVTQENNSIGIVYSSKFVYLFNRKFRTSGTTKGVRVKFVSSAGAYYTYTVYCHEGIISGLNQTVTHSGFNLFGQKSIVPNYNRGGSGYCYQHTTKTTTTGLVCDFVFPGRYENAVTMDYTSVVNRMRVTVEYRELGSSDPWVLLGYATAWTNLSTYKNFTDSTRYASATFTVAAGKLYELRAYINNAVYTETINGVVYTFNGDGPNTGSWNHGYWNAMKEQ